MAGSPGYSLLAPDPRLYDDEQAHVQYARMFADPNVNAGSFMGIMQGQAADAQRQRQAYEAQLALTNKGQYDLGLRKMAQDDLESRRTLVAAGLKDPAQMSSYSLSRAEIAPDALPHMGRMADAGLQELQAKAYRERMQGYKLGSDAGVSAPAGASFDPTYGTTTSAGAQGQRPDITIAGMNLQGDLAKARATATGPKTSDGLNLSKQYIDIDENIANKIEEAVTQMHRDNRPTLGADGTTVIPAPYTEAQMQQRERDVRARMLARARQQQDTLRGIAERTNLRGILPPRVDYSMNPEKLSKPQPGATAESPGGLKAVPTPSPSPAVAAVPNAPPTQALPAAGTGTQTAATQGGPPLAVGGGTGNQRSASPTPDSATLDGQLRTIAGIANTAAAKAKVAKELSMRGLPPNHPVAVTRDGRVAIGDGKGGVAAVVDVK